MRPLVDQSRLKALLAALGQRVKGPGTLYLVGGATALLEGWRASTIDVDLKLDPEPAGIFEAIADLKNSLDINIELASPDHFIPELPGWRERSRRVGQFGQLLVYHYDAYSQALAKIERGHNQDLSDVHAMLKNSLVDGSELRRLFALIAPNLIRYPAIDPAVFADKLERALAKG